MIAKEAKEAVKTTIRLLRIAIKAEIKKVLSPISETMIMEIAIRNGLEFLSEPELDLSPSSVDLTLVAPLVEAMDNSVDEEEEAEPLEWDLT
ncbi:hypothetical protein WICPIJ_001361 [Wickerhamomyces pijperi]|uniref:Uncharacterized protein n=1 Tax=Wickerhamomyces pijperi TaxID=599730 RepID=A0A9P8QDS4_WICPI|nr:hypothetical protein WICPIJ_001361 [Wickerhamomyces pijperi]